MKSLLRFALAATVVFGGCAGCRDNPETAWTRVGVLMPTSATPVAAVMKLAMETAAAENGAVLFWRDTDVREPGILPADQEIRNALELFDREKIEVLVYTPIGAQSAIDIFREAKRLDIPVVALDSLPVEVEVVGLVTSDFLTAGEEAASAAVNQLRALRRYNIEGQFNTLVLEGFWQRPSEREVTRGNYRVLDATPEVRVVGRLPAQTPTEAFQFISTQLNNYAGNVQLLLIPDTRYVSGAMIAARAHGLSEWIVSASVGAGEEACRMVLEGIHDFEIDLMPERRAVRAIEVATTAARGIRPMPDAVQKSADAEIPLFFGERRLISRENVAVMRNLWRNLYPQ